MAQAGIIKLINGIVTALNPQGEIRQLQVGDIVHENEIIKTDSGASVSIELDNGQIINLGENAEALLDESVTGPVEAADTVIEEVEALQAALEEGENIVEDEETAAGEEDEGFDYNLAYEPGDQDRGNVGSYLFGTEYGDGTQLTFDDPGTENEEPTDAINTATLTLGNVEYLEGTADAFITATLDNTPETELVVTLSNGEKITFDTDYVAGDEVRSSLFDIPVTQHGAPGAQTDASVTQPVTVSGTNGGGISGSLTIINGSITILDDTPTANDDVPMALTEDGATDTVSGSVLVNDDSGADAPVAFVGWDASNAQAIASLGQYGDLTLNGDGTYEFVLDNTDADTQALTALDLVSEDLYYTMKDADGDESTAKLTISINGTGDSAKVNVAMEGTDSIVYEAGLSPDGSNAGDGSHADSDSFGVSATDGISTVTVGGETFTLVEIQALATMNQAIDTGEGTLVLNGYTGDDFAGTINYTYTLKAAQTHIQPDNDASFNDEVALAVTGVAGSTDSATLTIEVVDDVPTANDDASTRLNEDGTIDTISGSVLANDDSGADTPPAFVGWDEANAEAIASLEQYGDLTLNGEGTYEFVLDNTDGDTQALDATDQIREYLYYTMKDADGDESTAKLAITINGADEPVKVTAVAQGTESIVYEAGLSPDGSNASDGSHADSGSFGVRATDGISTVTVGGETFTLVEIQALATMNQTIDTGEGTLVLNGYTGDDFAGTINYTYTLKAAQTHTQPVDNVSFNDEVAFSVAGLSGSSDSATLTIEIVDDGPTANDDAPMGLTEEDPIDTVSGFVLANDDSGADTPSAFVGWEAGNAAAIASLERYGALTLNGDGTYEFVLDNTDADTQALAAADQVNEDFYYTMKDADGDESTAKLTITINGADEDTNVEDIDSTVYEAGLTPDGSNAGDGSHADSDSFSVSAADGISTVTVGGETFTLVEIQALATMNQTIDTGEGSLVLNGYTGDDFAGTINYTYTLKAAQTHTQPVDNVSFNDEVAFSVAGLSGSSDSATLTIEIVDDAPSANPDFVALSFSSTSTPKNIGLILDMSGSIDETEYGQMVNSVSEFISDLITTGSPADFAFTLSGFANSGISLGTFIYDGDGSTLSDFVMMNGTATLADVLDSSVRPDGIGRYTNFNAGLSSLVEITSNNHNYLSNPFTEDVSDEKKNLVYFFSDGNVNEGGTTITDSNDSLLDGIELKTIAIGNEIKLSKYAKFWDPDIPTSEILETDFGDLADTLIDTNITEVQATGQLLTNDIQAADSASVLSININGNAASLADGEFTYSDSDLTFEYDIATDSMILTYNGQPTTAALISYTIEDGDGDRSTTQFYAGQTSGTSGDDILLGSDQEETLDGRDGSDVINSGAGDDTIVFDDDDSFVDGGDGYDTLLVEQDGALDFSNVHSIETIDLNDDGTALSVEISLDDVLNMTDSDNILHISGEFGDSVTLTGVDSGGWTNNGDQSFTKGIDTVFIQTLDDGVDIHVSDDDGGTSFDV